MKGIAFIIICFLCSCNQMKYRQSWQSYNDSFDLYTDKYICHLSCNNDSIRYDNKMQDVFFR